MKLVALVYRVDADSDEDAIDVARDLAYEDVEPLKAQVFDEGLRGSSTHIAVEV